MWVISELSENRIITRNDLIDAGVGSENGYNWSSIDAQSTELNFCVPASAAKDAFSFNGYEYDSSEPNRLLPAQFYICLNPKILFSSRNNQFTMASGSQVMVDSDITSADQIYLTVTGEFTISGNTVLFSANTNYIAAQSGNATSNITFATTQYSATIPDGEISSFKITSISAHSDAGTLKSFTVNSQQVVARAYRGSNYYISVSAHTGETKAIEGSFVSGLEVLRSNAQGDGNYNFEIAFNELLLNAVIAYNGQSVPAEVFIQGPAAFTGTTCQYVAVYNNQQVTQGVSWSIVSGGTYATIDSSGVLTVQSSANDSLVTIQATYNGSTKTKDVTVKYQSGSQSSTETQTGTTVNPDGSTAQTTTTTTTVTDSNGNTTTTTSVVEVTTNTDGTSTETESTTTEYPNGTSASTTVTTSFDEDGNETGHETENIDTSGNSSTQTVVKDNQGNDVVTGYEIDTDNNPNGGLPVTSGIDTGVIVFDGHDWTATLKAKILFSEITPASKQFPIMNVSSRGDDNKLDGAFFLVTRQTSGMGSAVYDENGTQQATTTSSNPTLKWRIQNYLGGSLQNGVDFYYNNGTRPFYTNRFGSKSSAITLVYTMVYTESNNQLATCIYKSDGTTLIAKPRSEAVVTFTRVMSDITFEIGKATNVSGTELVTPLEVLDFHVEKTL